MLLAGQSTHCDQLLLKNTEYQECRPWKSKGLNLTFCHGSISIDEAVVKWRIRTIKSGLVSASCKPKRLKTILTCNVAFRRDWCPEGGWAYFSGWVAWGFPAKHSFQQRSSAHDFYSKRKKGNLEGPSALHCSHQVKNMRESWNTIESFCTGETCFVSFFKKENKYST